MDEHSTLESRTLDKLKQIQQCILFKKISLAGMSILNEKAEWKEIPRGTQLFSRKGKGDHPNTLRLIPSETRFQIKVVEFAEPQSIVKPAGSYMGEFSFMEMKDETNPFINKRLPASVDVFTQEETTLLEINGEAFSQLTPHDQIQLIENIVSNTEYLGDATQELIALLEQNPSFRNGNVVPRAIEKGMEENDVERRVFRGKEMILPKEGCITVIQEGTFQIEKMEIQAMLELEEERSSTKVIARVEAPEVVHEKYAITGKAEGILRAIGPV
ncbi:MAG: hypothetical protein UW70_C0096G0010, partial [Candidatus Peregrinibacteria bacterium GW2011_GWA2_44_7]